MGCGFLLWTSRKSWVAVPRGHLTKTFFRRRSNGYAGRGTLGAEIFLSRASLVVLLGGLLVYFAGWPTLGAVIKNSASHGALSDCFQCICLS